MIDVAELHETGEDAFLRRIALHAAERPKAIALTGDGADMSWHAFHREALKIGARLRTAGLQIGDRVGFISENSLRYAVAFLGTATSGYSGVTLPTSLTPQALAAMLDDSAPKILMVSEACRELAAAALVARKADFSIELIGMDFASDEWRAYEQWLGTAQPETPNDIPGETEFNVVYSSGTTGVPKGIAHNHLSRLAFSKAFATLGYDETSVNLIATPLYSNMSIPPLLTQVWAGGRVVILDKFDPETFIAASDEYGATNFVMVPTMSQRVLEAAAFRPEAFHAARSQLVAGAVVTPQLKSALVSQWPGLLVVGYGQTEGGPYTLQPVNDDDANLASVGRAVNNCEIIILDEEGKPLGPNHVGEIAGRMGYMMTGYINKPEETAKISWYDAEGRLFYKTGDVGRLDEAGYLYILDRKKDVIISGGFNIYASDLEEALKTHDAVFDAAVIGIPSERWGETPVALVQLRPGHDATSDAIRTWANARLGKVQRIRAIVLVDDLPRNPTGKILKAELRKAYDGFEVE